MDTSDHHIMVTGMVTSMNRWLCGHSLTDPKVTISLQLIQNSNFTTEADYCADLELNLPTVRFHEDHIPKC